MLLAFAAPATTSTSFDERLWEKYADIQSTAEGEGALIRINLSPYQIGNITGPTPFADFRVVSSRRQDVPFQVFVQRPDRQQESMPCRMQNLSLTDRGETWVELIAEKPNVTVNALEINTPDTNFTRRVQVLGSPDGLKWNAVRTDAMIFDFTPQETLRRTRITFPQTSYRHLALKIENGEAPALTLNGVTLLRESVTPEQTYTIATTVGDQEFDARTRESRLSVTLNTAFAVDRLVIFTAERNFRRAVTVQIPNAQGVWQNWSRGTILKFDTPTMHEEHMALEIPAIAAKEFRLVFHNRDNPPVRIARVSAVGYQRVLVCRQMKSKMYLFWGNPSAVFPQYDLGIDFTARHLDALPMAHLGAAQNNNRFAGNTARMPFTERYKYLLYGFVILVIVGLLFLQYRVFRNVKS